MAQRPRAELGVVRAKEWSGLIWVGAGSCFKPSIERMVVDPLQNHSCAAPVWTAVCCHLLFKGIAFTPPPCLERRSKYFHFHTVVTSVVIIATENQMANASEWWMDLLLKRRRNEHSAVMLVILVNVSWLEPWNHETTTRIVSIQR